MLSVSGPERHVRGSPMVGVIGRETPRRERREVYAAPTRVWKTRLHCFDCNSSPPPFDRGGKPQRLSINRPR